MFLFAPYIEDLFFFFRLCELTQHNSLETGENIRGEEVAQSSFAHALREEERGILFLARKGQWIRFVAADGRQEERGLLNEQKSLDTYDCV